MMRMCIARMVMITRVYGEHESYVHEEGYKACQA